MDVLTLTVSGDASICARISSQKFFNSIKVNKDQFNSFISIQFNSIQFNSTRGKIRMNVRKGQTNATHQLFFTEFY